MRLTEEEFIQLAEELDERLGREATEEEILAYAEQMEERYFSLWEDELNGN